MSKTWMSIRYSHRWNGDAQHPMKALRFETEDMIPELLIESLEDAGFFATPHPTMPLLLVTPTYSTGGNAMVQALIATLSVWNQVHIGYTLPEEADRELWMASEYTQPSRARCEPPAHSQLLRQIGRLRFDYDTAMLAEQYEAARALNTQLDQLKSEVSRIAA